MITTKTLVSCPALRTVPENKYIIELADIDAKIEDPIARNTAKKIITRYYESNIPVKYWKLNIKSYKGDDNLLAIYNEFIGDIHSFYKKGKNYCFAGTHGIGKTYVATAMLKKAVESGFSGLYVNLSDIMSVIKSGDHFLARKELLQVDFLVIDEFDPRHMGNSDNASDFHGRVLEDIFRNRSQNMLPLVICTNSPDPVSSFNGSVKMGIESLWNYMDLIPVFGKDFRKLEKNESV
jgi:DNA replication protein DnaC